MAAPHLEFFATQVSTSGTRVQIKDSPRKVLKLWIKARESNTNIVYLGDSGVTSTAFGFSEDIPVAGKTTPMREFNFTEAPVLQSTFHVDASTNGDYVETIMLLQ